MSIVLGGGQRILDWLAKCGVIVPAQVRRITIDLDCTKPARIYFDCFADTDLFTLPLLDLSNVEIVRQPGAPETETV